MIAIVLPWATGKLTHFRPLTKARKQTAMSAAPNTQYAINTVLTASRVTEYAVTPRMATQMTIVMR